MTALILTALLVFGLMVVEAVHASRNERAQRAKGGIEPADDVYSVMRFAYPGVFAAMIAESALRTRSPKVEWLAGGLALFLVAKAFKWWAIASLGSSWTFRVIVVPGMTIVRSGPYRFLKHPNYVAVVGEIVAVWMMTGARVTGPLSVLFFGTLIWRRVAIENRALNAILRR